MIYHIASASDWRSQQSAAHFVAASLAAEGFIHCSISEQIPGVVERYFGGVPDLLLLHIDESRLTCPCKFEAATGGEWFPHVYGPIDKVAITCVEPLEFP